MNNNEIAAEMFGEAIRTIAAKPDNLGNLVSYLIYHFPEWLEKFADTPEKLAAEMKAFAEMEL